MSYLVRYSKADLIHMARRVYTKEEIIRVIRGGRVDARPVDNSPPFPLISISSADGRLFCYITCLVSGQLIARELVSVDDLGIPFGDVLRSIIDH